MTIVLDSFLLAAYVAAGSFLFGFCMCLGICAAIYTFSVAFDMDDQNII